MAEVKIVWDGKSLEFPKWMFSRTVWVSVALGALNVFENVGDLHAFGAQFGIDVQDYWINWINAVGAIAAIWFRIQARQPLGIDKGKFRPFTPEELAAIKAQLKAEEQK